MEIQTKIQDDRGGAAAGFSQACGGLPVLHRASALKKAAPPYGRRGPVNCLVRLGQGDVSSLAWPGTPFTHPRGRTVARSARSVPGGMDIIRCI